MPIIPTTEECIKLLDEFNVPENVRQHSFSVNKVSMFIAKKLKGKGININLDLVNAASLLHDLDKIETLYDMDQHGKLSQKWFNERNHSKVGEVVRRHKTMKYVKTWEDKIVNYSDKRCSGGKIVSLKERYEYIRKTYAEVFEEHHETDSFKLEKEIFNKLDTNPEDIKW